MTGRNLLIVKSEKFGRPAQCCFNGVQIRAERPFGKGLPLSEPRKITILITSQPSFRTDTAANRKMAKRDVSLTLICLNRDKRSAASRAKTTLPHILVQRDASFRSQLNDLLREAKFKCCY